MSTANDNASRIQEIDNQIHALRMERYQLSRTSLQYFLHHDKVGSCCRFKTGEYGHTTYVKIVGHVYSDYGAYLPKLLCIRYEDNLVTDTKAFVAMEIRTEIIEESTWFELIPPEEYDRVARDVRETIKNMWEQEKS